MQFAKVWVVEWNRPTIGWEVCAVFSSEGKARRYAAQIEGADTRVSCHTTDFYA